MDLIIVNQIAQPVTDKLIAIGSTLLGAIVGGASIYLLTSRIEKEKMKRQAYIQLNAIKRAIGQAYYSYAEARLMHRYFSGLRELGRSSKLTSDDNYMRWLTKTDVFAVNLSGRRERLSETTTLVKISFQPSPELEQRVNEIERLTNSVDGYVEDNDGHFEKRIREVLRSSGTFAEISTEPMMKEILAEVQKYIETNVEKPIDSLIVYLDREL
jgi:hypothetical protein